MTLPLNVLLQQASFQRFTDKEAMKSSFQRYRTAGELVAELFRIRPILLHPAHRFGIQGPEQTREVLQYVDDVIAYHRHLTTQLYGQVQELHSSGLTMREIWHRVPVKMGFDLVRDGYGLLAALHSFNP